MDFKTRCARGCRDTGPIGRPLSPPVVMSATFGFETLDEVEAWYDRPRGYMYGRYGNPTVRATERALADLEGGADAALFGSGMAAISTTLLTLAGSGHTVAAQRDVYGGTAHLLARVLPELGIETRWFDTDELNKLRADRLAGCRLLYVETPTNPTLRIVDLGHVARAAAEAGIPVVVDSTFATPALQRPLDLRCDIVVHSCTKYLGGHSDLTGGVVVGAADVVGRIATRRRSLGGIMDPWTAFLLQRGLRTLAVRIEAQSRGAAAVAEALRSHPQVRRVLYPGLSGSPDHALATRQMQGYGGMVAFEVEGGLEQARRVHDAVTLFARAGSLGGVESLVSVPVTMSHRYMSEEERRQAGVTPGLIRLSIGLESPEDLIEDLRQALG